MHLIRYLQAFASLLAFSAVAPIVSAQVTLVQWTGASGIVSGTRTDTEVGSTVLDFDAPNSPAVGANYYSNNTGYTPVFYTATYNSVNNPAPNNQLQIVNDYDPDGAGPLVARDQIKFNFDAGSIVNNVSHGVILWRRYGSGTSASPVFGFLNGGDNSANPVTLSSLSITGQTNSNTGTVENRFIIQLGSSYYISSDVGDFIAGTNGLTTLSIADVSTASWFNYDPTVDIRSIGGAAVISSFEDLQAVGYFFTRETSLRFASVNIDQFSAMGTIPEPSTYGALLALGSLAIAGWRRARRREF